MDFTYAQTDAVEYDGDQQILACAGSGKTSVLAAKVAHLLKTGIAPAGIVAFSFTEAAGQNLKRRIQKVVTEEIGNVTGLADLFVGTIHSFCLNLLQEELHRFRKCSVLTEVQAKLLLHRYPKRSGLTRCAIVCGASDGTLLTNNSTNARLFLDVVNTIREEIVPLGDLPPSLRDAHSSYLSLLEEKAYLDYAEILNQTYLALTDDRHADNVALQHRLSQRLRYVIVDEAQDNASIQDHIIRRLHNLGARVVVCGDDSQVLFNWRGASIDNFLDFPRHYPGAAIHYLDLNFRSSEGVVETARKIVETNAPFRPEKCMEAAGWQTWERGDILALTFNSPDDEAHWIADKIHGLVGTPFLDDPWTEPRGLDFSDIAILLRSVKLNGDPIAGALSEAGIPFIVRGMNDLLASAEAEAMATMFDYLANAADTATLWNKIEIAELGASEDQIQCVIATLDEIKETFGTGGHINLQDIYQEFLAALGIFEENIPVSDGAEVRREIVMLNLGKISHAINDFESIWFRTSVLWKVPAFARWLRHDANEFVS